MKLYTRKGDDGKTHLFSGPRVAKNDPHIEACGAVDELNALLGVVRAEPLPEDIDRLLHRLQHELFGMGADLATPKLAAPQRADSNSARIGEQHIERLERDIDHLDALVPALQEFILPGGVRSAALLHVARTVCPAPERRVVDLVGDGSEDQRRLVVGYLNRLGDLLFVLPRVLNARAGVQDECWCKDDG